MDDVVLVDKPHSLTDLPYYFRHFLYWGISSASFGLFDHFIKVAISGVLTDKVDVLRVVEAGVELGDIGVVEEHV